MDKRVVNLLTMLNRAGQSDKSEYEAAKKRLEELKEEVASLQLQLATLTEQLIRFRDTYARTVGLKLIELDQLKAKLAEELAKLLPKSQGPAKEYLKKQRVAEETRRQYQQATENTFPPKKPFIPTADLKNLFREVAKAIHPDLAENASDREVREELMKRANIAYADGNIAELSAILNEWGRNAPLRSTDPALPLNTIELAIFNLEQNVERFTAEIQEKLSSDVFKLYEQVEAATAKGQDLLLAITKTLELQILHLEKQIAELQGAHRKWEQKAT